MKIEQSTAKRLVEKHIRLLLGEDIARRVEVVDDRTVEVAHGWVFVYQTRRYLETGNKKDALIGAGPLLVDNEGQVISFGSTGSIALNCKLYEEGRISRNPEGFLATSPRTPAQVPPARV